MRGRSRAMAARSASARAASPARASRRWTRTAETRACVLSGGREGAMRRAGYTIRGCAKRRRPPCVGLRAQRSRSVYGMLNKKYIVARCSGGVLGGAEGSYT